ncbi:hypothetical protein MKX03_003464 [Papaver bracteatum]|nr:hypothetical protein MKX03_003464 [Papaver bracteatum]
MAFSYTCLGGATLKTLKFSSRSSILRPTLSPPAKTLTLHSLHHLAKTHKFPPFLTRAVSVSAGHTLLAEEETAKPYQWKATVDFKWIRDNKDAVASNIKSRNSVADLDLVLDLYERSLNLQKEGLLTLEEDLLKLTEKLQKEAQCIPNMAHPEVPIGGEDCSGLRKMVSGSKFYYLKNEAVMLEMGLTNWAIAETMKRGFTPLTTPEIVRSSLVKKCGFQPRGSNTQVYSIEDSDQCLIGTAEIPVGGIHMDSILADSQLPLKYVAYSHCFRTEAGAAGSATSDSFHQELIEIEEDLFSSLGLHFKTLDMATGDLGAPAYRKFDVEAYMPGLGRYGEISSASNCTDYQSRRLGIRFRPSTEQTSSNSKKGKANAGTTQFVHTLNATACAVPRMIVCLLENIQQEDGSVVIPEPLRPFMGGLDQIRQKGQ